MHALVALPDCFPAAEVLQETHLPLRRVLSARWFPVLLAAMLLAAEIPSSSGASLAPLPVAETAAPRSDARSQPLDFAYRVQGSGPAIGVVFDDGRDVFVQPVQPLQASSLRISGLPHAVQGPYLVIRGLANRFEVSAGTLSASTLVEYRGGARAETAAPDCAPGAGETHRASIPFGTGTLRAEPGGLDHLAKVMAIVRGADHVTLVSQGDRPQSPIAIRRAARVRELLVAAGVPPESIVEQVRPPAASTVHVLAVHKGPGCARARTVEAATPVEPVPVVTGMAADATPDDLPGTHRPVTVAPVHPIDATHGVQRAGPAHVDAQAAAASMAVEALNVEPAPELRLLFQPGSSVQATLRTYLRAHGMAVEFKGMPVLMVEEFAEVSGADLREVLRRALSRLGLRGEIQGNRLLVVELSR